MLKGEEETQSLGTMALGQQYPLQNLVLQLGAKAITYRICYPKVLLSAVILVFLQETHRILECISSSTNKFTQLLCTHCLRLA